MKILVLGGNGMLGHQFLIAWSHRYDVKVTLRHDRSKYIEHELFNHENSFFDCDIRDTQRLIEIMREFSPDAVINATGVTKKIADARHMETVIEINALFPHKLARLCEQFGARMIQFSSDCIFSGKKGNYGESDVSDAEDLYGKTKYLGEVDCPHVVTLRKSTIGLELSGCHGLVEWFLAQKGKIKGFRQAIYTGLISSELVRVVEMILLQQTSLSGIWNVANVPINKFDLLNQLQQRLDYQKVDIIADDSFVCDRSLTANRFQEKTGYQAPSWSQMLDELALEINSRQLERNV